jgi:L-amino acid N-acyltransferase YncA
MTVILAFSDKNNFVQEQDSMLQKDETLYKIREATATDFNKIWPIFHEIVLAGETYAYTKKTSKEEARRIWMDSPIKTFVAEDDGQIVGTYYIKKIN